MLVAGCAQRPALLRRGVATPPPIGPPAAAVRMPKVTERVLPNGLTVLVSEYHSLPIMRFHLLVPGGGAYDPAGKEGVAELTAALLDQGTTRRSAEELAREVEFLGGDLGADAGTDFSTVSGEFLSKDLDAGLDLFSRHRAAPGLSRRTSSGAPQGLALAGIVAARENPSAVAEVCYAR